MCEGVCVCVYVHVSWLKGGVAMGVAYCKKAHIVDGFTDLHNI